MTSFRFLHFTDLHAGIAGEKWLYPDAGFRIREHLKAQNVAADVLFFTGDLTQRGTKEEFGKFEQTMEELREAAGNPILVTVPGNHDLIRPKSKMVLRTAQDWFAPNNGDIREEFYKGEGDFFDALQTSFASYTAWWSKQPIAARSVPGLLPGDFATTLDFSGLKIGVVGLNTAFLHLYDARKGGVSLDPRQLHKLMPEGPDAWARQHHLCLLLTHHGPEWLDATGLDALHTEINPTHPSTRFPLHLFGHDHAGQISRHSVGGGDDRTELLGRSLLGLEKLATGMDRSYGFSVGRVDVEKDGGRSLVLAPLTVKKVGGVGWNVVPDSDRYILPNGTELKPLSLGTSSIGTVSAAPPVPSVPPPPADPLTNFRLAVAERARRMPTFFVTRHKGIHVAKVYVTLTMRRGAQDGVFCGPGREKSIWNEREFPIEALLKEPHRRWVVLGEPGCGKTTQLHHLTQEVLKTNGLPILLKVSELSDWDEALNRLQTGTEGKPHLEREIQVGNAVILLDGLDEVLDKPAARLAIRNLARRAANCLIVVSSRPYGYDPLSDDADEPALAFQELGICPLDETGQLQLLEKWDIPTSKAKTALAKVARHSRMKQLATNPLLLSMMALLLHGNKEIPDSRADLYRDAVQLLLTRETGPGEVARHLRNSDDALELLSFLALALHDGSNDLYNRDSITQKIRYERRHWKWLTQGWGDVRSFLKEVCETTFLLVPDGPDPGTASGFAFPHRTFREYLAARALAGRLGEEGIGKVTAEKLEATLRQTEDPVQSDEPKPRKHTAPKGSSPHLTPSPF